MARYLTPLPSLLAGLIDRGFNQAIQLDAAAAQRLQPLDGRTVKLALTGLNIDLFFTGDGERLVVSAESDADPDTTIIGSPTALLAMSVPDWQAPGSGVRIEGDAGTAQALQKLFKELDPDIEALLTRNLGPVVGHQIWRLLRDAASAGRHGTKVAGEQIGRYLREESGLLVNRDEMNHLTSEVDELREAVDRLEARLRRSGRT
jgi:ubiquinone biosynthesis protein UbiJ